MGLPGRAPKRFPGDDPNTNPWGPNTRSFGAVDPPGAAQGGSFGGGAAAVEMLPAAEAANVGFEAALTNWVTKLTPQWAELTVNLLPSVGARTASAALAMLSSPQGIPRLQRTLQAYASDSSLSPEAQAFLMNSIVALQGIARHLFSFKVPGVN